MTILLQNGAAVIVVDRIAGASIAQSGRVHNIHVHLAHSVPLHLAYEDHEQAKADWRRLLEAMREAQQAAPDVDAEPEW